MKSRMNTPMRSGIIIAVVLIILATIIAQCSGQLF